MTKLIFLLTSLITGCVLYSQKDFQGVAVYESKTSTADFKSRMSGNKDMTPEIQKSIEERMKKMFEKTFILNFDKSASIYKEEEKLEAPGQNTGGGMRMMNSMMGGGGTLYKNVKDKLYVTNKEFMGKEFLIKDMLTTLNWKLESESRIIGGYNCFKATAIRPVNKSDFRNYRLKKEKTPEEKAAEKDKKTNFMDDMEMPSEIIITAWYTPEIPLNQGPESYWGLPGLILEVNDGKTVILCSKVVMNSKDKVEIVPPTNGKVVTQSEYDEIVVKKMEEWKQMNQGNGNRTQMRPGGQ
ncbi:MAG TPA: GLPGLI family protein [Flavobacterium sp.]|nr:GLPGLI family protein [Flavobacterium sp.]